MMGGSSFTHELSLDIEIGYIPRLIGRHDCRVRASGKARKVAFLDYFLVH